MSRPSRADRRRAGWAAAALGALTVTLAACGVQPTDVNVARPAPITVPASSPSASASASAAQTYPVQLFLTTARNQLVPVTRYLLEKPSPAAILAELVKPPTADEVREEYFSAVPTELSLKPTNQLAHEFGGSSPKPLSNAARLQIICSLDVYWTKHPDGQFASTQLIVNGQLIPFDDCPTYVQAAFNQPATVGQTTVKPGAPSQTPAMVKTQGGVTTP